MSTPPVTVTGAKSHIDVAEATADPPHQISTVVHDAVLPEALNLVADSAHASDLGSTSPSVAAPSEPEPPPATSSIDRTAGYGTSEKADAFLALDSDELMQRIRDRQIPKEVMDSKDAMMSLQVRIEQISQMNGMLTQLLSAIHQMNMTVVQNLRV